MHDLTHMWNQKKWISQKFRAEWWSIEDEEIRGKEQGVADQWELSFNQEQEVYGMVLHSRVATDNNNEHFKSWKKDF